MKWSFHLAVLLVAFSVAVGADVQSKKDENDIREVAIRALFKEAYNVKEVRVFFLSADEGRTDPSDDFMSRFASHKPPVRKVSRSHEKDGGVVDKQTGERGIIFSVVNLRKLSDTHVLIDASVYRAGLNGYTDTYTLMKKSGKWKVTDKTMKRIS